jgi:hypothetical protein
MSMEVMNANDYDANETKNTMFLLGGAAWFSSAPA